MQSEVLISVIIPVYNVEKYIRRCLDSICNQTYEMLDIILIDDGSKDSSGRICDEYKMKDERIQVIHKENAGLGMARNTGLEYAKGQYIAFVDSDDFVSEDYIMQMYSQLMKEEADTCYAGYYEYYSDKYIVEKPIRYNDITFEDEDILDNVLLGMIGTSPREKVDFYLPMSVWHALYSKDIICNNKIYFPSEREYISEDIIFHVAYLQHAKKVTFTNKCIYFYRCNNNTSLTHNFKENEFERNVKLVDKIEQELEKIMPKDKYINSTRRLLLGRFRTCIQKAVRYSAYNKKFDLRGYVKKLLKNKNIEKCIKNYPIMSSPIKHLIFNLCIYYKVDCGIILLAYLNGRGSNRRF